MVFHSRINLLVGFSVGTAVDRVVGVPKVVAAVADVDDRLDDDVLEFTAIVTDTKENENKEIVSHPSILTGSCACCCC